MCPALTELENVCKTGWTHFGNTGNLKNTEVKETYSANFNGAFKVTTKATSLPQIHSLFYIPSSTQQGTSAQYASWYYQKLLPGRSLVID